eukprot:gene818-843_t
MKVFGWISCSFVSYNGACMNLSADELPPCASSSPEQETKTKNDAQLNSTADNGKSERMLVFGCNVPNGVGDFVHLRELLLHSMREKVSPHHIGIHLSSRETTQKNTIGLLTQFLNEAFLSQVDMKKSSSFDVMSDISNLFENVRTLYVEHDAEHSAAEQCAINKKLDTILIKIEQEKKLTVIHTWKELMDFRNENSLDVRRLSVSAEPAAWILPPVKYVDFHEKHGNLYSGFYSEYGASARGRADMGISFESADTGLRLHPTARNVSLTDWLAKTTEDVFIDETYWNAARNQGLTELGFLPATFSHDDRPQVEIRDWKKLRNLTGIDPFVIDFAAEDYNENRREIQYSIIGTYLWFMLFEKLNRKIDVGEIPRLDMIVKNPLIYE